MRGEDVDWLAGLIVGTVFVTAVALAWGMWVQL